MNTPAGVPFATAELADDPAGRAMRRAWAVLLAAFAVFVLLLVGALWGARWVYQHATVSQTARLEIVSGEGALVRSPADTDWRLVADGATVREDDVLSTALGTVVRLVAFDGSTVEISEDSVVKLDRLRVSRFLDRTKLIVLEPARGTVYVTMEPHGAYDYAECIVRAGGVEVVMPDGNGTSGAGTFIVEVRTERGPTEDVFASARVAVLRGLAHVRVAGTTQALHANQQTVVSADGTIAPVAAAVRELLRNGNFARGLSFWTDVAELDGEPVELVETGASVELVPDRATRADVVALELQRASLGQEVALTGVRQHIGQTLRRGSSLLLQFEVWIDVHAPPAGARDDVFPLVIAIEYVDEQGEPRRWWHAYYTERAPDAAVPVDDATELDEGAWQRVAFDLRNLSPRPRQISTVLVYASGQRYRTRVTNLSLTSSELIEQGR